jgi:glycosyltransferase involved in cell wall biosynthesis
LLNVKSIDLIDSKISTLEENDGIKFYAEKILKSISGLDVCKSSPLFTVIIPVYGHFNYLEKCLESVGIQENIGIEIICINDASPDLRIKKLFDMMADRNPQLIVLNEEKNLGISEVQNKAVELAKGEFVVFLDCDDYLQSGALKAVAEVLRRNPDVDYIFTDRQEVDEFGSLLRIAKYGGYENIKFKSNEQIPSDLIDGMVASHLKVIRTAVYKKVGGCDSKYSGVQDWDLALKISNSHKMFYLAESLYCHRVHVKSVTLSDREAQFRKTNIVRRRFLEEWRKKHAISNSISIYSKDEWPSFARLKEDWQNGNICVADMRGEMNLAQVNYLREVCSYFDEILWTDPLVPTALYGYLSSGIKLIDMR